MSDVRTDLIEQLRNTMEYEDLTEEAADEIERLRALIAGRYQTGGRSEIDYQNEIERLRKIEKHLERMLKDAQAIRRGLREARDEIAALRAEDCR